MRLLRSHSAVPLAFEQLAAADALISHGRALQQDQNFQQRPPDLAGSGGITIIAVLGGCLAAVIFLGVVGVCLNKRFRQQRAVAPDPEAGAAADGSAAEAEAEGVKPKAMDRARSAYLIEGPDGDLACGVRISSFTMRRQRTASLELPATVPETSKGLVQRGSGSSATEGCEASSTSSSGDLGSAPQQPPADAAGTAGRQPPACRSDSSGSGMSCDTAVEGLSRASSGSMADAEAAAEQACSPAQLQGRQAGQEQANGTSQQPHMEGDTATQDPAAAQADGSPAGDPLTLRQRFSFGLFRPPPPPPPPPQDAAPQMFECYHAQAPAGVTPLDCPQ